MAIFRAGKRVGPFDLRVGFPRDRSLDNVDRDPRLTKIANSLLSCRDYGKTIMKLVSRIKS